MLNYQSVSLEVFRVYQKMNSKPKFDVEDGSGKKLNKFLILDRVCVFFEVFSLAHLTSHHLDDRKVYSY